MLESIIFPSQQCMYDMTIGVRANIHLGGGRPSFARMDSVGGGSSRNFSAPGSVGGGVDGKMCSVNCSDRPSIRVIHTFIVFCPNHFHSLPEFMSTNCPSCPQPPPPPSRTPMDMTVNVCNYRLCFTIHHVLLFFAPSFFFKLY